MSALFTPHQQQNTVNSKAFRQDINGLRAIAVLAVVLYHFGVPGFAGGFVGVDVFFVLSGFLMTGIIIKGLARGNFSLWHFYLARARRIVPALWVLVACLLALGWFWLPNEDYKLLAGHGATALAFVSNLKFWREAGYFDAASHEKWLLHTWSLSVEWQFYILLPIGCWLIWRFFRARVLGVLLVLAGGASMLLSFYASQRWPGAAFYLLPTRMWEMLAGGLVWWLGERHRLSPVMTRIAEVLGLALIALAIFTFDASLPWPGPAALVPVLGAMLVLIANRQRSFATCNWLSNRLGASSYSIYLWHWPLVVALNYAGELANPMLVTAGVLLSWLLGEASLRWVENPARKGLAAQTLWRQSVAIIASVSMLGVAATGVWVLINSQHQMINSRSGSSSLHAKYMDSYARDNYLTPKVKSEYRLVCDFFDGEAYKAKTEWIDVSCTQKISGKGIFVWGDSHAQALSFGLRSYLKENVDFYQVASSGCQPRVTPDSVTNGEFKMSCDRSNTFTLKEIKRLMPEVVLMAQAHSHENNEYQKIVETLKMIGIKHVILVGPVPQWQPSLPRAIALRHFSTNEIRFNDVSFDSKLLTTDSEMKLRKYDFEYISVLDGLCNEGGCLAKTDNHNTPLVWDYGHLSLDGSRLVVRDILSKNSTLAGYLNVK